jgi:hypothetical protein
LHRRIAALHRRIVASPHRRVALPRCIVALPHRRVASPHRCIAPSLYRPIAALHRRIVASPHRRVASIIRNITASLHHRFARLLYLGIATTLSPIVVFRYLSFIEIVVFVLLIAVQSIIILYERTVRTGSTYDGCMTYEFLAIS